MREDLIIIGILAFLWGVLMIVAIVIEWRELDAEAERLVRSRGWNEDEGRAKKIGRFQTRW